jgi:hypothetical protein
VTWTIASVIGVLAVAANLWRRQWVDAALVAFAAVALALLGNELVLPARLGKTITVDAANPPASVEGASALRVEGDGLRAAQWDDLPARPLEWTPPASAAIELDFPQQLSRGRMFSLTVRRGPAAPARLQLLAENGQLLAEARGEGDLTVQWLPPVAERLALAARLLDGGGKVIAQGPVPVNVVESEPLRVQGRFGAPSFDLRALDQILGASNALVDMRITLGKAITRAETARDPIDRPDLLVVDAAWFEHAAPPERASLLAQVEQGRPLLVLGSNAADAGPWSRTLQLALRAQPDNAKAPGPLEMPVAPLNPASARVGDWAAQPGSMLWTRRWHAGRIGWLGVGGWHRHAITEPQQLALWWQSILDGVGVERAQEVDWLAPEEMPLPGQRLELCARGVRGQVEVPELKRSFAWERRPDRVDASCVAFWPDRAGWLTLRTGADKPVQGAVYVYAPGDWPLWQAAQRRHATALYAARTPAPASGVPRPVPRWPFALLFAAAMLALWWRERR